MNNPANPAAEADELLSVHIRRIFPVSRKRVFEAWTSPEVLRLWWGPKGYNSRSAQADPRPGGAFSIEIEGPDGEVHVMSGFYTEVVRPELVCMEIRHRMIEGAAERPEGYIPTQVRVELREHSEGTELILLHTGFLDAALASRFNGGWASSFDKLETALAS